MNQCFLARITKCLIVGLFVFLGAGKVYSQSINAFELQFKARNFGLDMGVNLRTPWRSKLGVNSIKLQDVFMAKVDSQSVKTATTALLTSPRKGDLLGNQKNGIPGIWVERTATSYLLELGTIKDPREQLVVNERLIGSRPFKVNKVSHTWVIRPSIGKVWSVSERRSRNDVGFRMVGNLGLPVAYSWPIYIWLYKPNFLIDGYVDAKYDPATQSATEIGGTASWSKGIKQGHWIPGASASGGFQFEWGSYKQVTNSFTLGCSLDYFVKKIPNWYNQQLNRNIFPAVFVTFAAGIAKND